MNLDHIIHRVSELTGVSKEKILSKTRNKEVTRCRAMIVELCGNDFGVREIGRSLGIDYSCVSEYRKGNVEDKWKIKNEMNLLKDKVKMVSNTINFTYPGEYYYV